MAENIGGPLGDGSWVVKCEPDFVDVWAMFEEEDDVLPCTITKASVADLRDFAQNLERAADYLEGKG